MATRTLFRNGVVHGDRRSGADTALAVEGDRIAWVGDEDGATSYDGADEVVNLPAGSSHPRSSTRTCIRCRPASG